MRVSLKWLRTIVPVDMTVAELHDTLDMTGTAVESVERVGEGLDGVVIGRILTKERHPEADTLWVTTVDVGGEAPLNIVCGAQNFEAGDKVPVAVVGTTLPNGMTIKKAKLRGITSEGMNCSATELGVGGDASGLLILPADAPVGTPFSDYYGLADTVFDLEITPNRPDCMSMVGVAREVGAVTGVDADFEVVAPPTSGTPATDTVRVRIEDSDLCPRYTARVITGVKIGPSPHWLAERVIAAGARPINNVVDISNYVMFEMGQPLHAFDMDTLKKDGGATSIIVRRAAEGEKLETLDGQMRSLTPEMLVIADPGGAVALAGVMGGADTEVSDTTTNILLEAACFKPASISRTSRQLGLVSDASSRFERGVDPNGCETAADRACQLLAEFAGGTVAPGIVDVYPAPPACRTVPLSVADMNAFLGTEWTAGRVADVLTRLGLDVFSEDGGSFDERSTSVMLSTVVPSFRPDLEREVDLYEEVVRVVGMGEVAPTLPAGRGRIGGLSPAQKWRERVATVLRAADLCETMTYGFADVTDRGKLAPEGAAAEGAGTGAAAADDGQFAPGEIPVELINPMSEEQTLLRWTLAANMVKAVARNRSRGTDDVRLFEIGVVFKTADGRKQPKEREVVGGVLAGRWSRTWHDADAPIDFYDGSGVVESLMGELGITRWKLRAATRPWLQPGRSAEVLVGGEVAGWVGDVHPLVAGRYEAGDDAIVLFELDMATLLRSATDAREYRDVPRFPSIARDIALVVPAEVTAERLMQAISSAGGKLLEDATLFDVYEGEHVAPGKKSMAVSLVYRAPDRTLTDEEVATTHERLVRKVCGAVGGELRG